MESSWYKLIYLLILFTSCNVIDVNKNNNITVDTIYIEKKCSSDLLCYPSGFKAFFEMEPKTFYCLDIPIKDSDSTIPAFLKFEKRGELKLVFPHLYHFVEYSIFSKNDDDFSNNSSTLQQPKPAWFFNTANSDYFFYDEYSYDSIKKQYKIAFFFNKEINGKVIRSQKDLNFSLESGYFEFVNVNDSLDKYVDISTHFYREY